VGVAADDSLAGVGKTTLDLQRGSTLTSTKGVEIAARGVLAGSGGIGTSLRLLPDARLKLDLPSPVRTGANPFDFIRIDGPVVLGGTLEVNLAAGFQPTRGQLFDVLDFRSRTGAFAVLELPGLTPEPLTWDVSRLSKFGILAVSGATLFAGHAGVYTGALEGSSSLPGTSGSVLLTVAANGRLTGSFFYGGRKYTLKPIILNVDGSATITFGNPGKTLNVQVSIVNDVPQLAATVSTGNGSESQAVAARANPAFPSGSPYVGRYTLALPPDPAHPEATFPQGTGYATLSVSSRGQAVLVGVLGDGTGFSAGGPLTADGNFPFYAAAYGAKGYVSGRLTLHAATATQGVEGSVRWYKPATLTGKFKELVDAQITVLGSGFQNPPAVPAILNFTNGKATFRAQGADLAPLADKAVTLHTPSAFKSDSGEPFALGFGARNFGLGSGTFRDASNKSRSMRGVVLQKQNQVIGLLIGTTQNGTFEVK
jgi:hypothetical protein